jgi:hypothetical protein
MQFYLPKKILSTVIYYNILDYPLTAFELWQYLIADEGDATPKNKCALGKIIEVLESEEIKNNLEEYRGFYFLRGRKDLVAKRIQSDKDSIPKFKIAERAARWMRFVPFVRMVAVTGTLAMKNPERNSDIDFFVVLERRRIWTGRLWVTIVVHFLGIRRHKEKIKNRICLNYFITTGNLEIERQDLFAANEYAFIYPLFAYPNRYAKRGGRGFDTFQKFCSANREWINRFKPNWEAPEIEPAKYFTEHSGISQFIQRTAETLINFLGGDIMEAWLKEKQIEKIETNPLTHREGAYVEATDENLVFLPEPQGPKIYEEYKKDLEKTCSSGVSYDESFG